jgi:acetyl esterase/lipase
MPLEPRVKRFLDLLAAGNPSDPRTATVEARRQGLIALMQFSGPQIALARVDEITLPLEHLSLVARVYSPHADAATLPGLIYFHGGGLVAGSIATHDGIARALADAGGVRVISVDYRLAPEARFPAALDDAKAAVTYIASHCAQFGLDPARLAICGDSAGATLVAATCQAVARAGSPRLALQLLLCPILDYSRRSPSREALSSGYLVDEATLDHDLLYYLPNGVLPSDPKVSPLLADDLTGLPRTIIHTAEFDPLRDEGREYFERLSCANIEVAYTCHPGMIHLFYGLGGVIPYARTAFKQIGEELRAALAAP